VVIDPAQDRARFDTTAAGGQPERDTEPLAERNNGD
jgi:hypothetical protein